MLNYQRVSGCSWKSGITHPWGVVLMGTNIIDHPWDFGVPYFQTNSYLIDVCHGKWSEPSKHGLNIWKNLTFNELVASSLNASLVNHHLSGWLVASCLKCWVSGALPAKTVLKFPYQAVIISYTVHLVASCLNPSCLLFVARFSQAMLYKP